MLVIVTPANNRNRHFPPTMIKKSFVDAYGFSLNRLTLRTFVHGND